MPQIDLVTYIPVVFYLCILFLLLVYILNTYLLPYYALIIKMREKINGKPVKIRRKYYYISGIGVNYRFFSLTKLKRLKRGIKGIKTIK
jgi:hypothetical protein